MRRLWTGAAIAVLAVTACGDSEGDDPGSEDATSCRHGVAVLFARGTPGGDIERARSDAEALPGVESAIVVSRDAAVDEHREMFADVPALVPPVDEDDVEAYVKIYTESGADGRVARQFENRPHVIDIDRSTRDTANAADERRRRIRWCGEDQPAR